MLLDVAAGLMLGPVVMLASRDVRIADVVRASAPDDDVLSPSLGRRLVLRLPIGRQRVSLPAATVAALVRRAAPSLTLDRQAGRVTFVRPAPKRDAAGCWAAARPLAAGAVLTTADVAPSACIPAARPPIRYDRAAGAAAARTALAAGAPLGAFVPAADRRIGAGQPLRLHSTAGPVRIELPVTTIQPGRSGRSVFVRDAAGRIFAAPLVLADAAR
ncbi:MAG TPA: hypothetical protein VFQ57_00970 [Sphingomonas sp.]|jgi:flagella basal body P-ring formation protein FlgA|nr:hypothetical protein [Sphingomonas sp.]